MKEQTIKDLFEKYKIDNDKIGRINYHLGILNKNPNMLINRLINKGIIEIDHELSEEEMVHFIVELILKCDDNNPEFDAALDEELTRYGNEADMFKGGHNHNKWNTGTFEDDGFGFGKTNTDLYDDLIDSENDRNYNGPKIK